MRKLYFITLLLVFVAPLAAKPIKQGDFTERKFTVNNGLSQGDAIDILQDSYGYIWVATNDGLNRYDGYNFVTYTIGDRGLNSSLIVSLCEDQLGNIWVGTADDGFYYYVRGENRFHHQPELSDDTWVQRLVTVKLITVDDQGVVWAYESMSHKILKIAFSYDNLTIQDIKMYSCLDGDKGTVYRIVSHGGAVYLATSQGVKVFSEPDSKFVLLDNRFEGAALDANVKDSNLFVCYEHKLLSMNLNSGVIKQHYEFPGGFHIEWVGSYLWSHSHNGIYRAQFNAEDSSFGEVCEVCEYDNLRANVLMHDGADGLWVGFMKAGLRHYKLSRRRFNHIKGIGNNHIMPIFENDDRLFIGTEGSGAFIYDNRNRESAIAHILSDEIIYSIEYSPYDKKYYISTTNDIVRVAPNSFVVTPLGVGGTYRSLLADSVYMWGASYGFGLRRMNLANGEAVNFTEDDGLPSNIVRNQMLDSRGNLWICTDNGLFIISKEERFAKQPTIKCVEATANKNHYAIPIIEDRQGRIWYGTLGRGLHCLTSNGDGGYAIKSYTMESGLSNNSIKAIVEDEDGDIWVSSNRGICCLDTTSDEIQIFDQYDGLQDYEFNELSAVKLRNGEMLFGGVNGYNGLVSRSVGDSMPDLQAVLTDFRIFNESVFTTDEYSDFIPAVLQPERGVRLEHNQNSFSFSFSTMHNQNVAKSKYRCYLEGYDLDYVDVPSQSRVASYVKVPYGDYVFHLQTTNEDGVWSKIDVAMPITVVPPVWARWYANVLYFLMFVGVLLMLAKYYRDRIKRRAEIRIVQMERNRARDMLEMRTKFFANVSHEFRTPLTLILSPLQKIMEQSAIADDPKWQMSLKTMEHNASSLLRLVNELLAYVKQESGKLKIELQYCDFAKISRKLVSQFQFWADQSEVNLDVNIPDGAIELYFDRYLMEQIIYNLVSNAIKHTPAGGTVSFNVEQGDGELRFYVKDTGVGISKEQEERLFQRFASVNANNLSDTGGIGIGLILTKSLVKMHNGNIWLEPTYGRGATFGVSIPMLDSVPQDSNEVEVTPVVTIDDDTIEDKASHTRATDMLQATLSDGGDKPTMLIVDDNRELLILLRDLFEEYYRVELAECGKQGIDKARELIPDMIISDIMMPDIDGLELCRVLKSDLNTSHIPIVMLTAKSTQSDIAEGYRRLADAYCTKPFNNTVLIETINSILINRRAMAARLMGAAVSGASPAVEASAEKVIVATSQEDSMTAADREFLKRITDYIEENIGNNELVITDVCNKMGLTPLALNKKLKALLNTTTNALIRSVRLHRAAALIKTGRYSIADVTYDVGFSDLRYFRECFKKEFGVLPQAYKDMHTGDN